MRGEGESSPSPLLTFSPAPLVWAGAAALCGALASGLLWQPGALQPAFTALVLAMAWQVLWWAGVKIDWQPARASWRSWSQGTPKRRLPYTQAGSDADQVSKDVSQFGEWVRAWLLPRYGGLLFILAAALVVSLVVAMALGLPAVMLTILVLIVAQVAWLLCAGNGRPAAWSEGLAGIGLPFALGLFALAAPAWPLALACGVMGVAFMALKVNVATLLHAGSALAIAAFVLLREPAAAFVIGVLWATGVLLKPAGNRPALVALALAGAAIALLA